TPDEVYHYAFVRHIAQGNSLPVQQPDVDAPWEQEGSQAPLYYLLVGWLTRGIDQSDFAALSVRNPRANIGDPLFPGNKNFMLYSAADHPRRGANLALHVGRWVSLVLGLVTLWCAYLTVQLACRGERSGDNPEKIHYSENVMGRPRNARQFQQTYLPLITTLWIATIPQFAFISASCSNDSLIIAASAATIYWLARLLVKPKAELITLGEWLVLGMLLGIAALSKLQGLGLVALAGLMVLWLAWQRRNWRLLLTAALPVALPVLAIAGWWYARNVLLYGDLFGVSHLLANNGLREEALHWSGLLGELRGLRYSFWGLFGWFNLLLPGWVYGILDGVTVVALLGLIIRPFVGPPTVANEKAIRGLALLWTLLSLLLLAYWISQATGSQGRLLFPAIGVIIYLAVDGLRSWGQWVPLRLQPLLWGGPPILMLGSSLFTVTLLYPQAYGALTPVATLPADLPLVAMRYQGIARPTDEIQVLAVNLPADRYQPGDRVPVTLYLQADQPIEEDYQLFIQLLNEDRVEIGNLTSHPGWGRFPTSLWQPGAIYADSYPVLIDQPIDNRSPLLATVYIGFVNPATEKSGRFPIRAFDRNGNEVVEPFLGHVAVSPLTQPDVVDLAGAQTETIAVGTQFGSVLQLSNVLLPTALEIDSNATLSEDTFTVTLVWDAVGTPTTDYTAFVHFIDANGERATGFDQAPALRFPTQYWRSGDRIVSTFAVPMPTSTVDVDLNDYAIWVGLYEAGSGGTGRLPVTEAAGMVAGDGQVLVRDRQ
ncbi:MAG: hypothetical protein KDE19_12125, partial [Caldilineaceae bacterium]|nr:hypothetical protein [Caldilineaceae bacterium]